MGAVVFVFFMRLRAFRATGSQLDGLVTQPPRSVVYEAFIKMDPQ